MKKISRFLFIIVLVILAISILFIWLSKRERTLALEVAVETAKAIMQDPSKRDKLKIPEGSEILSLKPVDTNLYGRSWNFWFDVKPSGNLVIDLYATRGIAFIPLFNRKNDFKFHSTTFTP